MPSGKKTTGETKLKSDDAFGFYMYPPGSQTRQGKIALRAREVFTALKFDHGSSGDSYNTAGATKATVQCGCN